MKKNIILSAALMFFAFTASAQTTITFDENDYKKISVYDQWEESPFREGGALAGRGRAAVTNNPYAEEVDPVLGEVLNSTANVLALQRSRHGGNAFGVRIDLKEPIRMTKDFQYIHVMTYLKDKPADSRMMVIGLGNRIESSWEDQPEDVEQFWALTSDDVKAQAGWQDVVVKFNGFSYSEEEKADSGIVINSLVIVPDVRSPHADAGDWVAYFDDVKIDNSPMKRFTSEKYALNADKETAQTRSDRHLNSVGLTVGDKSYSSTARSQKLYTDNTASSVFSAAAGDVVQPTFDYTGGTMHGFVYVDWDNNGVFKYEGEESEVVSYKEADVRQGVPTFTIPENTEPGLYRMRYKVDWKSMDPAGNDAANNKIAANGGGILDLMLDVHAADAAVSVSAEQLNGNIWDENGSPLATATYGEPLKVKVAPADGFVQYGFTLRYGYDVSAEEQFDDNGNPRYLQVEIPYSDIAADGTYTIPGEYMRGAQVSLEGNMQGQVLYTVEITGDGGKGGVEYAHAETKDGGTIYATQYLTAEQLTPTPIEHLVAEVTVNRETHVVTVAYGWAPPTRVTAIDTEKFYTLRCKADKHGNVLTGRYIGDDREVIDGHSEEGTPFRFIAGEEENTYYIQSIVSDRYINVKDNKISVSAEKITAWTFNVPSGSDYDGTVTFGITGNKYLNNVNDDVKGESCVNLKPSPHDNGPGSTNACSLWYLEEYDDLNRFVVEYTVEVTGTAGGGVTYEETVAKDGEPIAIPLSLTAGQVETVALDGYTVTDVTINKLEGIITVNYTEVVAAQWNFTFNRTATTATVDAVAVTVATGGVPVKDVTATILPNREYKTVTNRADVLCLNLNTGGGTCATEDNPNKYTLTITNNSDTYYAFDYIEVSGLAVNGNGNLHNLDVDNRMRNFKVTYGETTIGPKELYICKKNVIGGGGKEYPHGFGAKVLIPAHGTYTIEVEVYNITHDAKTLGNGSFYGITKIALGHTAVSFGTTGFSTLYAPIALIIPEGVTAYTGALSDDNTLLTLTAIEDGIIPMEHAVILASETTGTKMTFEEAAEEGTAVPDNALKGQTSTVATTSVNTDEQEVYTLQTDDSEVGVAFKRYVGANLSGGKAYLMLPKSLAAQQKAVRFRFAKSEGTTEIEDSELSTFNSQFSIYYDLQGRRVLNPGKGVYIVNGKKVVIK